ncbi:uncharacterized protein N7459_001177 [Penicillium hispanicum]|uniref:uncharacterized protein n=1 Tax=Penicillium hispanicum TaxID=1080232 RepID=UPI00254183FF|nr:uncharacterized protein N7459_001177 [Penicillium hispanicum]KAJ5594969.1 hypothetical protein N7459_001177 [Penicillium hispanicum]
MTEIRWGAFVDGIRAPLAQARVSGGGVGLCAVHLYYPSTRCHLAQGNGASQETGWKYPPLVWRKMHRAGDLERKLESIAARAKRDWKHRTLFLGGSSKECPSRRSCYILCIDANKSWHCAMPPMPVSSAKFFLTPELYFQLPFLYGVTIHPWMGGPDSSGTSAVRLL